MVFNRFGILVLVRVVVIVILAFIFSSIFLRPELFFTQIILGASIIALTAELIRFVNQTNTELAKFLGALNDDDFQLNFNAREASPSFRDLYANMNNVLARLQESQIAKDAHYQFLNQLINQIKFGIIVFKEDGEIEVMNNEASRLVSFPKVAKWEKVQNPNKQFILTIFQFSPTQNQLLEATIDGDKRFFSINVSDLKIQSKKIRIVCFQDIKSEIQQKEIEAWHKLIRVLTHETMNSISPIVSLAETMKVILTGDQQKLQSAKTLSEENIADLYEAINTIIGRGEGILKFVTQYRKLTKIPQPEITEVDMKQYLNRLLKLIEPALNEENVTLEIEGDGGSINMDPVLIEQVMINLIKNSIDAMKNVQNKRIKIIFEHYKGKKLVSISDNGQGISSDKTEKVFIPFYTTKTEGSGIGLSVSRQIMRLHQGNIDFRSIPLQETTFTLTFPL